MGGGRSPEAFTFSIPLPPTGALFNSVAWESHLGKALSCLLRMLELFRIQIENTHLAVLSIFIDEILRPRLVKGLTQGCTAGSWQGKGWNPGLLIPSPSPCTAPALLLRKLGCPKHQTPPH